MSSPAKNPANTGNTGVNDFNKLAELKPADIKLLILGTLCVSGKMDYDKLARITGLKKTSATSNYNRSKKRMLDLVGGDLPDDATEPTNAPDAAGAAGAKHPSPEETPTKRSPIKRRKIVRQIVSSDADEDFEEQAIQRKKDASLKRDASKLDDSN
ncbi:hypothetical protein N7541_009930 [Penicillium brevicompactum]|uniref:Uncharacterized protein n=1 Tax=Penicillium brevicompactum TaxID=5074 RepID=A0A9W9UJE7_PENBR|nr:hypothetical protein N7541_009930 [Penicillium brevicompactum]